MDPDFDLLEVPDESFYAEDPMMELLRDNPKLFWQKEAEHEAWLRECETKNKGAPRVLAPINIPL